MFAIDSIRRDHMSCYGYPRLTTPHLDRLAKESVICRQGYVTGHVCSPTRTGLMTGRYQQRFGHEFNPGDNSGLPLSETTIANRLKVAGYVTGLVGKWHLGSLPQFHPQKRGFDEFFDKDLHSPPRLSQAVGQWLPAQRNPLFLFVNILDPHEPYEPPPPLDTLFPTKRPEFGTMISTFMLKNGPLTPAMREHFAS
jgi:arylsulfatase A-like enzyme